MLRKQYTHSLIFTASGSLNQVQVGIGIIQYSCSHKNRKAKGAGLSSRNCRFFKLTHQTQDINAGDRRREHAVWSRRSEVSISFKRQFCPALRTQEEIPRQALQSVEL